MEERKIFDYRGEKKTYEEIKQLFSPCKENESDKEKS